MKNIIFDWSGVVRDTLVSQLWIVNRIFGKYGISEMTLEEFRENWEQPYMLFYEKYLPKSFIKEEQEKAYREAVFNNDCPKSFAFLEMTELIRKSKNNGIFLAVVSSDLKEMLRSEVKEYGLENIFNEIATDVHDKFDAVEEVIRKNNLNLQDTFFVGDSNHEIEVAKKAGIKSIAVTWGFTSEQRLIDKKPDYIVNNARELEHIIL